MKMNRRNALIGLGAIATGGGAIFGSGAFSQVAADRNVAVEMAGDGSAFLQLSEVTENSGYVSSSGGTISFNLNENGGSSGQGLNYDAVTYIQPLFDISNQGNGEVRVLINGAGNSNTSITDSPNVDGIDATTFQHGSGIEICFYASTTGDVGGSTDSNFSSQTPTLGTGNSIVGKLSGTPSPDNSLDLAAGGSVEIGAVVDSTGVTSAGVATGVDILQSITLTADAANAT